MTYKELFNKGKELFDETLELENRMKECMKKFERLKYKYFNLLTEATCEIQYMEAGMKTDDRS